MAGRWALFNRMGSRIRSDHFSMIPVIRFPRGSFYFALRWEYLFNVRSEANLYLSPAIPADWLDLL